MPQSHEYAPTGLEKEARELGEGEDVGWILDQWREKKGYEYNQNILYHILK